MSVDVSVDCPSCDGVSSVGYRCEHCGRDLTGETTTAGMEEQA